MTPASDPVRTDSDPHIVLGIVGDPGAAFSLARELADTALHTELDKRLAGARWCIEVMEGRLVQPPATDAEIVKAARRTLLDKQWDVIVYLTDLPLHVEQRPVVAHANPVRNVAIVSVPALGAMGARNRIREVIGRLLVRLLGSAEERGADAQRVGRRSRRVTVQRVRELGSDPSDEAFFYTARVLTGNLTLISGMVAANQPWRLSLRLSRALTGAVAAGVFGLVTADIWRLSDAYGWDRLAGTAVVSIVATVATLIIGAELWEPIVSSCGAQASDFVQHRNRHHRPDRRDRVVCRPVCVGTGRCVLVRGAADLARPGRSSGCAPGLLRISLADFFIGDGRRRPGCRSGIR